MLSHGGKRSGAGRKKGSGAFGEATKVVRIPESQVDTVKIWLQNYKDQISEASLENLDAISGMMEEAAQLLPLYSHKVAAGFPSPADDFVEARLDLNEKLAPNHSSTFLLKVQGESMRDAGIFEDDILIVDRSIPPRSGKIVIAAVDGELTVKRLDKRQDGVYLLPENPDFPEIKIHEDSDMVIWGVVTSCIHQF